MSVQRATVMWWPSSGFREVRWAWPEPTYLADRHEFKRDPNEAALGHRGAVRAPQLGRTRTVTKSREVNRKRCTVLRVG